jgi:hypothetical protein
MCVQVREREREYAYVYVRVCVCIVRIPVLEPTLIPSPCALAMFHFG